MSGVLFESPFVFVTTGLHVPASSGGTAPHLRSNDEVLSVISKTNASVATLTIITFSRASGSLPHSVISSEMQLSEVLFDAPVLRAVCSDLLHDVRQLASRPQLKLVGNAPTDTPVDTSNLVAALEGLAREETPLWELQWMALAVIYLSDSFVTALREGTYASVIQPWVDGHDSFPCYEKRFEGYVMGKFGPKPAKGARKEVVVDAKHPLEAVVDAVMDVHRLMGMECTRV